MPSKRLSPEKFAHHVMVLFFPLRDEPLPLLFHWKKNRLNIYLLRNNYISEVFKKLRSATNK